MTDAPEEHTLAPPLRKLHMISDMELGATVIDIFVLASAQQGQARNGPYWRLEFRDASGIISGKIWSPQSQAFPSLSTGTAVRVTGKVTSYRDKLELAVDDMRILDDAEFAALDLAQFMPASPFSPDAMLEELTTLCRRELTHKPWKKLILGLLADEDIAQKLRLTPAAKVMHHAYAGGLLEHTLSVAHLCMKIADHYPTLDRQALLAAAICHDLGKMWELSSGIAIDYTREGRLIGHIFLAIERLAPFIKKSGLEPDLAEHLKHLILSHHGTHEFGSPRLPATAEALVLHYADNLDAKLQQVESALAGVEENGWSAYNPPLERHLFRATPSPRKEKPIAPEIRSAAAKNTATASSVADSPDAAQSQQPLPLFSQCSLLSKE